MLHDKTMLELARIYSSSERRIAEFQYLSEITKETKLTHPGYCELFSKKYICKLLKVGLALALRVIFPLISGKVLSAIDNNLDPRYYISWIIGHLVGLLFSLSLYFHLLPIFMVIMQCHMMPLRSTRELSCDILN